MLFPHPLSQQVQFFPLVDCELLGSFPNFPIIFCQVSFARSFHLVIGLYFEMVDLSKLLSCVSIVC